MTAEEKPFTIVIRAFGEAGAALRLQAQGSSLAHRAHRLAGHLDHVRRVVVLADEAASAPGASRMEIMTPEEWSRTCTKSELDGGVISLDARCMTLLPADLEAASRLFLTGPRTENPVVAVYPLPSHHHPLKTLLLGADQELRHYDAAGKSVYQRQQTAAATYWVVSEALWIGQSNGIAPQAGEGALAHKLALSPVLAQSPADVALSLALLEGWRSSQRRE